MPEDGSEEKDWGYVTECSRLLRWLDAGGNEFMGEQDFLLEYLRAVGKVGATHEREPFEGVDLFRLTDDQATERRKKAYARRNAFVLAVNTEALKHWGDGWQDAWQKANENWRQFNRDFKP